MRVNVYGEELTSKIEIVKKAVDQKLFIGVRFYLKSHPDLHHSETDNDESAVTFWLPLTRKSGNDFTLMRKLLLEAHAMLANVQLFTEHQPSDVT